TGEPTRDLLLMARENVRSAVRVALHRAKATNAPATVHDGWIEVEGGERQRLIVTASPVADRAADDFVVSFQLHEETPPPETEGNGGRAAPIVGELRRVRDELQSTVEELQTSNEELKASTEELT